MSDGTLQLAVDMVKKGDKKSAYPILVNLAKNDPDNLTVWLWLAASTDSDEEKTACLRKALEISPGNTKILTALEKLTSIVQQPSLDDILINRPPSFQGSTEQIQLKNKSRKPTRPSSVILPAVLFFILFVVILPLAILLFKGFNGEGAFRGLNAVFSTRTPMPTTTPRITATQATIKTPITVASPKPYIGDSAIYLPTIWDMPSGYVAEPGLTDIYELDGLTDWDSIGYRIEEPSPSQPGYIHFTSMMYRDINSARLAFFILSDEEGANTWFSGLESKFESGSDLPYEYTASSMNIDTEMIEADDYVVHFADVNAGGITAQMVLEVIVKNNIIVIINSSTTPSINENSLRGQILFFSSILLDKFR